MANRVIIIEIDQTGDLTIDLEGYKGKGCAAVEEAFRTLGDITKNYREKFTSIRITRGNADIEINSVRTA
jgi:hypothetical protein